MPMPMPNTNTSARANANASANANANASASASLKPVAQFSLASGMASAHLQKAEHFSLRAFIFDTWQPHILKLDKNGLLIIQHIRLNGDPKALLLWTFCAKIFYPKSSN